jgi:hypothetical protein
MCAYVSHHCIYICVCILSLPASDENTAMIRSASDESLCQTMNLLTTSIHKQIIHRSGENLLSLASKTTSPQHQHSIKSPGFVRKMASSFRFRRGDKCGAAAEITDDIVMQSPTAYNCQRNKSALWVLPPIAPLGFDVRMPCELYTLFLFSHFLVHFFALAWFVYFVCACVLAEKSFCVCVVCASCQKTYTRDSLLVLCIHGFLPPFSDMQHVCVCASATLTLV